MKKSKFIKGLSATLGLTFVFGAVGCGGHTVDPGQEGGGSSDKTVIEVMNFGGGVGRKWLDQAVKRFETAYATKSYETDKTGVEIKIENNINTGAANMASSGIHIYFDQASTINTWIQQGLMLDITDVVTEVTQDTRNGVATSIEGKIDENLRYQYKGNDGNYYALPHYEFYDGLTYDVELFENEGFYFAANPSEGTKYTCSLVGKDFYFVKSASTKKSCGNDGKFGTQDDGLPTTLEELIALCDYMKEEASVTPFVLAGNHNDYSTYVINGLTAALAGYDQAQAMFSFTANEVETVTGFSSDNLFPGFNGVKKPNTQRVAVTEETGYLAYNQVSKYYAYAFMQIAVERGWISTNATQTTHLHTDAMRDLILNGIGQKPKAGMIMEGSYWLNEAEDNDIFNEYLDFSTTEKKLGWMALPTSLNVPVTGESNAREMVMFNGAKTAAFINGNLATKRNTEGIINACKDFLRFLYSDAELVEFVKQSGTMKAGMEIEIGNDILSQMTSGQKSMMEYRANNRVLQQANNNPTLNNKFSVLTYGIDRGHRPYINGVRYYSVVEAVRTGGATAQACFESLDISESLWAQDYYKNN